jgi:hypothetical protein
LDHEPRPKISGARRRKAGALLLTVCFVRGVWRRAAFIRPQVRGGKFRRYLPFATISAEDVASPKSICEWAKSGQGRTFTNRQFCERASPMLDYFIATMACAENDVLNVFGCGRLIAGIGFLRLPASSTSV